MSELLFGACAEPHKLLAGRSELSGGTSAAGRQASFNIAELGNAWNRFGGQLRWKLARGRSRPTRVWRGSGPGTDPQTCARIWVKSGAGAKRGDLSSDGLRERRKTLNVGFPEGRCQVSAKSGSWAPKEVRCEPSFPTMPKATRTHASDTRHAPTAVAPPTPPLNEFGQLRRSPTHRALRVPL